MHVRAREHALTPSLCLSAQAYGGAISLGVAWVVFRFVGPNLGLYRLAETPLPPL